MPMVGQSDMPSDDLDRHLRDAMERHHFTTGSHLAEIVGVDQSTASRWLSGGAPRDDAIPALADFLGVPESEAIRLVYDRRIRRRRSTAEHTSTRVPVDDLERVAAKLDEIDLRVAELEARPDLVSVLHAVGAALHRGADEAEIARVIDSIASGELPVPQRQLQAAAEGGGADPEAVEQLATGGRPGGPRPGATPIEDD
jgi:transcriptional regulator with XRE-family HTH domain